MTRQPTPEPPGFTAFWALWPGNTATYIRKGAKAECLKRWKARHHESQAETILAHVRWLKTTADWLKDGGAYVPAPLVYLNQQRWDGAEVPEVKATVSQADETARYLAEQAARGRSKPPEDVRKALARMNGSLMA